MDVFQLVADIVLGITGLIAFSYGIYLYISKNINAVVLIQHERVEERNMKTYVKGVGLAYILMSLGYIIGSSVSMFSGSSFGTGHGLICAVITAIIGHIVIMGIQKKYNS